LKVTATSRVSWAVCLCAAAWSTAAPGCDGAGPRSVIRGLQSSNPSVRIASAVRAGKAGNRRALPLLVDRLEDELVDVRLFSIRALEKITGQTLGYRHYADEAERAEAVRRWREWLKARRPPGPGE